MVRPLIEDVTLAKTDRIQAHVRFRDGQTTSLTLPMPPKSWQLRQTYPATLATLDRLLDHNTDAGAAAPLNAAGHRSGEGKPFTGRIVLDLRRAHHMPSHAERLRARGLLDMAEITRALGVHPTTIKNWQRARLLISHEANDKTSGIHIQDRGQLELALIGGYLCPVAVSFLVNLARAEVPLDQVRRPLVALPVRVVDRRRGLCRAARPCSRIRAATVFLLTRQPSSRRSAVTRGNPYLPSCRLNRRKTSALSRSGVLPAALACYLSTSRNQGRDIPSARRPPRTGCDAAPSGRRSARPLVPPYRVPDPEGHDPEGHAALEDIALHGKLSVLAPQPRPLRPLILAQGAGSIPAPPLVGVDQFPRCLR
jgi:hypothetical protein